jgi:6,7-dimethyl-8-ribityllumazine synthase
MEFDAVCQWARVVGAWNARDWLLAEELTAPDFEQVAVVGSVLDGAAQHFDRATQLSFMRKLSERKGLNFVTLSVTGLGHSIAATYREVRGDGAFWEGCAIALFNQEGQLVQLYTAVPTTQ